MTHRWLAVAGERTLGDDERDLCNQLIRLFRAIDAQVRALGCPSIPADGGRDTAALTPREVAVLGLVAQGHTAVAIGRRLGISPRTVGKHQAQIYRKLDVRDRLGAVLTARQRGILVDPPRGGAV